jgi:aspartate carbamoyltransferase catalytic subunit
MTSTQTSRPSAFFPHRHLLGIEALNPSEISRLLDLANRYADLPKDDERARRLLRGRTVMNLFFEDSTPSPSAVASAISMACWWRSAATYCIAGSPVQISCS